ncbi:UNVERIFIED_ORG: putative long chain acyl-CoA synthase [Nocardia globerula]|uniref:Putative long chain acyl-CoA synthase n=1 Tax=Nocardia globerula TaxID=1818 RepID=A0A652YZA4_NOCGL|nr:acyl-CoA synthetase [Rhodococcus globerulus]NMD58624.1 AMP-binding protein [Nocardia globerula]PVX65318.1 putative long chain acyl-CoA synthase [Rhodococcus globerulus]
MVGLNSKSVLGPLRRVVATAQNGLEVVRLGGLETDLTTSPFEIVERAPMYRLRRYFPDTDPGETGPPIVLVPPMMMSAGVYDVTRDQGAVGILHEMGLDPWVVDFGEPDAQDGGWGRNLADHIIALSEIVDHVHRHTGKDVHLSGYSQGGMFAYQAAAYRQSRNIASLITFGSPVDTLAALPFGIPAGIATWGADFLADHVFNRLAVTGWMARTGFQLLDPVKTLKSRVDFLLQLHDREALLPREQQRRFLATEGWVGWSGPAVAELLKQFVVHNRMMSGGFVIKDQAVTLASITCPVLAFVGEVDDIGQPQAVRGITQAAPRADVYESTLRAGHFGLVVGSVAANHTWPTTGEFVQWIEQGGTRPARVERMPQGPYPEDETGVSMSNRIIHTVASVAEVGVGVTKGISDLASGALRGTFELSGEAARALPRLARLNQIQPHTKISLSALLAEQRRKAPAGECFLFDNRVHTYEAVNIRIDNVVRGLISVGVRPAAHVGILMETRPSALAAIAALSRLGAVAVMLPPGGDIATAVKLGNVDRIITDPENVQEVLAAGRPVLVLGGGDARGLSVDSAHDVIDLEQIDPTTVSLPGWYRPDPGIARELAFIIFAESGGRLEAKQITNYRWALSAFGTASAADLDRGDTVYCLAPLHHSSSLLATIGGAMAGGSRIALSRGLDPARFVEEIHRYGVTVVSYTWSMMRQILDEDLLLLDGTHPVRLFIGSGMPPGLWKRTTEAFDPAQILEFYASTEGDVILANVAGSKIGCKGRPLPGSARVRLAAYDPLSGRILENEDGFVRECADDEVGLLLGRAGFNADLSGGAMRGLFEAGDSWIPTENLFRRDSDGDYWLVDHKNTVISTLRGPVFTAPIVDALSSVSRVDLAVAYALGEAPFQLAVAAVTCLPGRNFRAAELAETLDHLDFDARPDIVHVVDEIAVGSSFRPNPAVLAAAGLPAPGPRTWYLDSETQSYKRLTKAVAAQLMPTRMGTGSR